MEIRSSGAVIALEGRFDGRSSAQVRAALYEHLDRHPDTDVVVDLARVPSIDVTALQILAGAAQQLQRRGHQLVLRDCSVAVARIIAFRRWRQLFSVERAQVSA